MFYLLGDAKMKKLFLFATFLLLLAGAVMAAPTPQPPPQTETEVAHLLDFVRDSRASSIAMTRGTTARTHGSISK